MNNRAYCGDEDVLLHVQHKAALPADGDQVAAALHHRRHDLIRVDLPYKHGLTQMYGYTNRYVADTILSSSESHPWFVLARRGY